VNNEHRTEEDISSTRSLLLLRFLQSPSPWDNCREPGRAIIVSKLMGK